MVRHRQLVLVLVLRLRLLGHLPLTSHTLSRTRSWDLALKRAPCALTCVSVHLSGEHPVGGHTGQTPVEGLALHLHEVEPPLRFEHA